MRRLLDVLYLVAVLLTIPVWLTRLIRSGKIRSDWRGRLGVGPRLPVDDRPRVLLHAVSVGEINAIRLLVDRLAAHPSAPTLVISTTTNTGFIRAASLFEARHVVVRFPLDLSWAVARFLDRVLPDVVVLAELEVWPNFAAECRRRGIQVCVVNGRLTARSLRRYRWVRRLIRPAFEGLGFAAVQTPAYADRFAELGVPRERVHVAGTMKWDTAEIADEVPGASDLAAAMGIDRARPLIVAGSTAPDEHALLVAATPPGVQLLCAPRRPEWFEQAALDLPGCARRSKADCGSATARFLLDTIGELRQAYSLADVVVIGRSFGALHGSDMMEPIALGKATIVGPSVADFQDVVDALIKDAGIVQTTPEQLPDACRSLLADASRRRKLAEHGRGVIRANQGATDRHLPMVLDLIGAKHRRRDHSPSSATARA